MARIKKIKFPLEMKDGTMVRTIEELREHFDAKKLAGHWVSGKLMTWLSDRRYTEEFAKISQIDVSQKGALEDLCNILQIDICKGEMNVQLEDITKLEEKKQIIRQHTDDEDIIRNLDVVAMTQEELDALLKKKINRIYVFGEIFEVKKDTVHLELVGINTPTLSINTDRLIDFEQQKLIIKNCRFDEKYLKLVELKRLEEENKNKLKRSSYQASTVFDYLLSNNDRRETEKLFKKVQDEFTGFEFDIDAGTIGMYTQVREADIYDRFDIDLYGRGLRKTIEKARLKDSWEDFLERIS